MPRHTKRDLSPGPGQLSMLMSSRDIMNQYQPLDGDRQEGAGYDSREYQPTARSATTGGRPNQPIGHADIAWLKRRAGAEALAGATHYRDPTGMETDEQLWSRKLSESQMSPSEYAEARGQSLARTPGYETLGQRSSAPKMRSAQDVPGGQWASTSAVDSYDMKMDSYVGHKQEEHRDTQEYGPSLYDSLKASGGVESPVHLGSQLGDLGKPEVVGGHHRIAAMSHINPDQLMPVVHHENIWEARKSSAAGGYKYT